MKEYDIYFSVDAIAVARCSFISFLFSSGLNERKCILFANIIATKSLEGTYVVVISTAVFI